MVTCIKATKNILGVGPVDLPKDYSCYWLHALTWRRPHWAENQSSYLPKMVTSFELLCLEFADCKSLLLSDLQPSFDCISS